MASTFQMEPQQYIDWCWAAVAQSIKRYFSGTLTPQCEIANEVLISDECCNEPLPNDLNTDAHLEFVLTLIGVLQKTETGVALPFNDIYTQIVNKQLPICARIGWIGQNRGHFVIVCGCPTTASGEQWVDIADPFYGYSTMPYNQFVSAYLDAGEWTDTFLVKPPAAI